MALRLQDKRKSRLAAIFRVNAEFVPKLAL